MGFDLNSIQVGRVNRPPRMIVLGTPKVGKALSIDTPILTENGFVPMGDIQVGDVVFDNCGHKTKVTNVTGIMHNRKCYKLTTRSGESLIADADHQWLVKIARSDEFAVKTTEEMKDDLRLSDRWKYSLPVAKSISNDFEVIDLKLPIDPYVLGFWLGDGSRDCGRVSVAKRDIEILDHLGEHGKKAYRSNCENVTILGLKQKLDKLGLINNKHIPMEYIVNSSTRDRHLLLEGLMDSDGYCANTNQGKCEFSTTDKKLADGVILLIKSLGCKCSLVTGRAMLNGNDYGEKYRINFWPDFCPFGHCNFKIDRFNLKDCKRKDCLDTIVSIEPVESVPVKCIEVQSPTHTYLAGDRLTVTHNTTFACQSPSPILLPIKGEEGADDMDIPKFPVAMTFDDVITALNSLLQGGHEFRTVIIDSMSTMEQLVHTKTCTANNWKSIEQPGWGKGFTMALDYWLQLQEKLDALRNIGMASILIGHVKVKTFNDPLIEPYDTYMWDIREAAASMFYKWCDCCLFARYATYEKKVENEHVKHAISTGERKLYTQSRPAHPGGGRGIFGHLDYEIPLSFQAFQQAVSAAKQKNQ